ncbi:hypothetical protein F511_25639 [Dorcoceras hygrometricum]|uniref:Uncharacterized protein n=1 Tax=Dorcoceras hygrometricum TaxID=472368 RepID=A0A2Z7BR86_9LAMI|nr:hypothetical protein F511_25639 [Dorcoceras hygrometricum]
MHSCSLVFSICRLFTFQAFSCSIHYLKWHLRSSPTLCKSTDSVLGIQDNEGMVQMFRALEANGLRGFLGCPSVAGVFNFPTDGLTDLSEVSNNLVLQARTLFSKTSVPVQFSCKKRLMKYEFRFLNDILGKVHYSQGWIVRCKCRTILVLQARTLFSKTSVPVQFSCKKRLMKYEFRFLNDILAKSITVKAGSFDAVTHERFLMMTVIHFGIKVNWSNILFEVLKEMADRTTKRAKAFAAQICVLLKGDPAVTLGEAKTFPPLKIISTETVNTYIATNKTIDALGESDEPDDADDVHVEVFDEKAVSKKRPAAVSEATVVKKKKTTSGKAVSKEKNLALISVAQDAVPIQVVEPISVVPAERPHAQKRKAPKRKLRLSTDDAILPSVLAAKPTKIKFGLGIQIPRVHEVEQYKASLPQIAATNKGKEPLVADTIQGHPAREIFSLICADIDFLVQLREQVIEAVDTFFNSFNIRRLPALGSLEAIVAKEEKVLTWGETDSVQKALQRRVYIVAKYRELLLRMFLEARRHNFVSCTPTTTIDLKVLELFTVAHLFALKVFLRQVKEHKLEWTRPSNSQFFEGYSIDRRLFIPRNHRTIFSTCWIRAKILVDGSWLIVEGVDFWRPITRSLDSRNWELLSASTINRCRDIIGPFVDIEEIPTGFRGLFQNGLNTNSFVTFLNDFVEQPEEQVLPEVESFSSGDSTVYRSPSQDAEPSLSIKQLKTQSSIGSIQNYLLSRIYDLEKASANTRTQQYQDLQGHFKSVRQEIQIQKTALSFEVLEFKKGARAQSGIFSTDLADIRKEVRDLSKELDDKLDAIHNDLFEFRVETREQFATLRDNLAELIAFVTRGRDEKKGEVGSSHGRGQPPPGYGGNSGSISEPSTKRVSSGSKHRYWRYWLNG